MISVCIATYNGEKHIKSQLDSIIPQLSENDEVIISDDGSTDETVSIIESYQDKRIQIIRANYHSPVLNFENAIKQSKGDYIFLSDQDDIWIDTKVARFLTYLEKYHLILSDCVIVNDSLSIISPSFFRQRESKSGLIRNLYKNSYMGCCMAFRKELLSSALPFPKGIHMHDWWLGLVAEVFGSVFFLNEPLILYRRHGKNASPTGESGYSFMVRFKNRLIIVHNVILILIKKWYQLYF
jgi:glycosyltransferase involved in cell wall biosynthesis